MEITRRSYLTEVFTDTYKIEGTYQPIGQFMTAINKPDSVCLELTDASFTPLRPGSALRTIGHPQVIVNKGDVHFMGFKDDSILDDLNMLKRVIRAIAYTPAFVLRGDFHIGAEDQFVDMLDSLRGDFQPLTDVTVFPLIETQVGVARQHALVFLNTRAIELYHPDTAT